MFHLRTQEYELDLESQVVHIVMCNIVDDKPYRNAYVSTQRNAQSTYRQKRGEISPRVKKNGAVRQMHTDKRIKKLRDLCIMRETKENQTRKCVQDG